MNTYKIKYQRGYDIKIVEIEARNKLEASYIFYMNNSQDDVLEIEEV